MYWRRVCGAQLTRSWYRHLRGLAEWLRLPATPGDDNTANIAPAAFRPSRQASEWYARAPEALRHSHDNNTVASRAREDDFAESAAFFTHAADRDANTRTAFAVHERL